MSADTQSCGVSKHTADCMDAVLQRGFGEGYSSGSFLHREGSGRNLCCSSIERLLPPCSRNGMEYG